MDEGPTEAFLKQREPYVGLIFKDGKRKGELSGYGSFFIMRLGGHLHLATAAHVVTDALVERYNLTLRLGRKAFSVERAPFAVYRDRDLAFAELSLLPELEKYVRSEFDLLHVPDCDEAEAESRLPNCHHQAVFFGFPGSKNRISVDKNVNLLRLVSIIADNFPGSLSEGYRREYGYAPKSISEAPAPGGMSGGPVFRIRHDEASGRVDLLLMGVGIEHVPNKSLIASRLVV